MEKKLRIAIDGPAGAGKSTVAKKLAARLGYVYVDTGAMYRAVTLKAQREAIPIQNDEALGEIARTCQVQLVNGGEGQRVLLDGEDVSEAIRLPEVSQSVSVVSAVPAVRERMTALQQEMAAQGGVVMDGRDIGTRVIPDAEIKFFLTASIEERARRRHLELTEKGIESDYEALKREIAERDRRDMEREIAPLVQAADALLVDSSDMSIDEVVEHLLERCRNL